MFEARLADIVAALGGELRGDGDRRVDRIGRLDDAGDRTLTFLASARYRAQLAGSQAAAVILADSETAAAPAGAALIVTPDPYLYFARLTQWWAARTRAAPLPGIHATAVIDPTAALGVGVSIGPFAVIEADAVVGDGAVVGAHGFVGRGVHLGAGTRLEPRVTVAHGCRIGARGILYSGAVIGADGFGHAPTPQRQWTKIEQLGAVRIGDDVEIGANTCVDRGALDDTVIEDGVKLDNQIQIAHNVVVGAHTAMAGCVGVAGSTRIGRHCTFGGSAMILGHLTLVDGVHVSAGTLISRSILKPGQYTGVFPFDDNAAWEKNAATLRQLHALRQRLRDLEKKTP